MERSYPAQENRHSYEAAFLYWLFAAACFLLVFTAWYPGVFTLDEEDILAQGLTGAFHDGHSPLLVRFWMLTGMLKMGPSIPYLCASAVAVFSAAWLLSRLLRSYTAATIGLLLFVFSPPVFVSLGLVTKDLFFTAIMLAIINVMATCDGSTKKSRLAGVLVLMQLLVLIRIDAVFALAPLAVWLGNSWLRRFRLKALVSNALSLLVAVVVLVVLLLDSRIINRFVFAAKPFHAEQVLMLFDLAAISVETDQMLIPQSRLKGGEFPMPILRARFNPGVADPIIWTPDHYGLVYQPNADHAELRRAWMHAIGNYPVEYMRARLEYASRFLGIRNDVAWVRGQFEADSSMVAAPPEQGWQATNSPLQRAYTALSNGGLVHYVYLPWIWIVFGVLAWTCWNRGSRKATNNDINTPRVLSILGLSALSYTFLMCLISASALARYHAWPRIAFGLIIAVTLVRFFRNIRNRARR